MSTSGPVQEQYQAQMTALCHAIDEILNGKETPKKVGFALLMFDFAGANSERMNYMSNAGRGEMLCALKELVARFEGRHIEETATEMPKETQ